MHISNIEFLLNDNLQYLRVDALKEILGASHQPRSSAITAETLSRDLTRLFLGLALRGIDRDTSAQS